MPETYQTSSISATKSSSPASIALAWLVVVIPAAWGVYNTALGADKLFQ